MVEGGIKCVKYLLFAFNLIFVFAAIGLIAAGAYVQIALKNYNFGLGAFSSAAALLIAVGVLIFFIAFFGCCGAIRENRICVLVFATLLVIIFILEIAGAIAGFVLKGKAQEYISSAMNENFKNDSIFWNDVQKDFKCCGIDGSDDWNNTHQSIPKSCCSAEPCNTNQKSNLYDKGCFKAFVDWLKEKIVIVGGVALGFTFIQVVGITFACCLANAIKKEYEVV